MNLANFPDLVGEGYTVISPVDPSYNCIAWAADDTARWWWPTRDGYWPAGAPAEETFASFVIAFETLGYSECDTPDLEPGYDKVALYGTEDEPTHAARQVGPDEWSSKIGTNEDITHTLAGLVGPLYGTVRRFLRRPILGR